MRIRVSVSVIVALFPVVAGFSSESSRRGDELRKTNYAASRSSQISAEFLPGQGEHINSFEAFYFCPLPFF
jgi:hypothetical protein